MIFLSKLASKLAHRPLLHTSSILPRLISGGSSPPTRDGSIKRVLVQLVGADDHIYPSSVDVMQWLQAESNLLEMTVDKLSPSSSPINAAETLCAIITPAPPPLAMKLSSLEYVARTETVGTMLPRLSTAVSYSAFPLKYRPLTVLLHHRHFSSAPTGDSKAACAYFMVRVCQSPLIALKEARKMFGDVFDINYVCFELTNQQKIVMFDGDLVRQMLKDFQHLRIPKKSIHMLLVAAARNNDVKCCEKVWEHLQHHYSYCFLSSRIGYKAFQKVRNKVEATKIWKDLGEDQKGYLVLNVLKNATTDDPSV